MRSMMGKMRGNPRKGEMRWCWLRDGRLFNSVSSREYCLGCCFSFPFYQRWWMGMSTSYFWRVRRWQLVLTLTSTGSGHYLTIVSIQLSRTNFHLGNQSFEPASYTWLLGTAVWIFVGRRFDTNEYTCIVNFMEHGEHLVEWEAIKVGLVCIQDDRRFEIGSGRHSRVVHLWVSLAKSLAWF